LKRQELLKKLAAFGVTFQRHGGDHDIYGIGKKSIAVPRHSEVNESTAKAIINYFSKLKN